MAERNEPTTYIEGIQNYCDRWCERCAFADRCRVADHEAIRQAVLRRQGRDPNDWSVVLDEVGRSFAELIDRVRADAEAMGIELPSADEGIAAEEAVLRDAESHPLRRPALEYTLKAASFLDDVSERLRSPAELGSGRLAVEDALDTISWYHTLVGAKLARAVDGLIAAEADPGFAEFEQSDANGSAKVAYLGLTASLKAFTALTELRPWLGPKAVPCILSLAELCELVDEHFPNHRTFVRPGFDDAPTG